MPERAPRVESHQTLLEDSSDYNNQPALHLRNGQSNIPNFVAHRHNSSIGEILQPTQNGGHHLNQLPERISSYARHM